MLRAPFMKISAGRIPSGRVFSRQGCRYRCMSAVTDRAPRTIENESAPGPAPRISRRPSASAALMSLWAR